MLSGFMRRIKDFILQGKKLHKIDKMEGHLGIKEGRLLFKLARSLKNNSVIVEIGAFKGESACFISEGIGTKNCILYSIDTWHNDRMPQGRGDVFADFLKNIEPYKNKIEPLRGYSSEVVRSWPKERKIDFLFIDGDHSYIGIKRDVQDWIPLVKKNGIICFHDYPEEPGVKKVVDEIIQDGTIRFIKSKSCLCVARRN